MAGHPNRRGDAAGARRRAGRRAPCDDYRFSLSWPRIAPPLNAFVCTFT